MFLLFHKKLWVGGGGWVAWSILVSAPVPFGFRSYWDLVAVGPTGVLGLRVRGQGLTIPRLSLSTASLVNILLA